MESGEWLPGIPFLFLMAYSLPYSLSTVVFCFSPYLHFPHMTGAGWIDEDGGVVALLATP